VRTRKPLIYLAGPYTHGDVVANVHRAIDFAEAVAKLGCVPLVPHLNMVWDLYHKHCYEFWLKLDFAYLDRCDGLLRVPGFSPGADREVERALRHKQPVFFTIANLRKWKRGLSHGGS
jgi:hypothetical protein